MGTEGRRGLSEVFQLICGNMWSVTPYALCDHRCRYCCTGVQGTSTALLTADRVAVEVDTFLEMTPPEGRASLLGAFSDGYPGVEAELGITRTVLGALVDRQESCTVITKGDTVLRDVDILIRGEDRVRVQVSVCSTDDDALAGIDGNAPSGSRRLEVIHRLHEAGIPVELNALPWIPGVTDTEALIAAVPADVPITFSPLSFGPQRDRQHLLGRTFTRPEVWDAYRDAYAEFGHHPNTSWVRPSPPPEENHPLFRLPTLAEPDEVPVPTPTRCAP